MERSIVFKGKGKGILLVPEDCDVVDLLATDRLLVSDGISGLGHG